MSETIEPPENSRRREMEDRARKEYLEALNADYEVLRGRPAEWAEFHRDVAEWDVTNMDGLERS